MEIGGVHVCGLWITKRSSQGKEIPRRRSAVAANQRPFGQFSVWYYIDCQMDGTYWTLSFLQHFRRSQSHLHLSDEAIGINNEKYESSPPPFVGQFHLISIASWVIVRHRSGQLHCILSQSSSLWFLAALLFEKYELRSGTFPKWNEEPISVHGLNVGPTFRPLIAHTHWIFVVRGSQVGWVLKKLNRFYIANCRRMDRPTLDLIFEESGWLLEFY